MASVSAPASNSTLATPAGHRLQPVDRRADMARIRQSRPDSVPGFQAKVLRTFFGVPSSLESGSPRRARSQGSWTFVSLNSRIESNQEKRRRRLTESMASVSAPASKSTLATPRYRRTSIQNYVYIYVSPYSFIVFYTYIYIYIY